MRVLIVEDNAFNAFCLSRLLTTVDKQLQVAVVNDSLSAINYLAENDVSLVILDGDLGAADGLHCNGPALAEHIWQNDSHFPLIAWSDSECMRNAFVDIFRKYNKPLNDYTCWTKVVSQERIRQSLIYFMAQSSERYFHYKQNSRQEHCLPAA
ncbi:two component sensor and regulator, histidine kinase response regulator [Legionella lansingensis]|uniref:Two component sensor and regulator histidine kinase response regulator n=1 Tax=Legionella lansingensis TaxID=45067 RepID=A0A0W0VRB4_9GAMM|nr:response regulator [Legionella lansingensis]KTD22743.1 two component sensor and regulator histidine kinase response regulator [Legionella lansingensis]SNV56781.1 two component sensor and regulator, histidine kinase response regulator [Legionella lansingensis]